jgi:hypothetical protein
MRYLGVLAPLAAIAILGSASRVPTARKTANAWDVVLTEARSGASHLLLVSRDGSSRILTPDFASAADPEVSFDGTHILFSAKRRAGDDWNIFEMNADGTGVRQITRGPGNCRSPIYQSPIFYLDDPGPMPQIAFVSDQPAEFAEGSRERALTLYSARMDGSGVRRLTYNPAGAFDPAMLPDGRMMFSAWQRQDRLELMAAGIDGTDYATISGSQGEGVKRMACVTTKGLVVFVETDSGGGTLGSIDLRRNLHSYRRLTTPEQGVFRSPSPLPDGSVLAAWRPAKGAAKYGIYRFDPASGARTLVEERPGSDLMQARALAARAVPDGHSSVVDDKQDWAKLYCLSVYDSDLDAKVWPRGLVKRLRVLEALPQTAPAVLDSLSSLPHTRFIGEVDIEEDGSFHLQIPASVAVKLQALDESGMALRTSAWIWAKDRERRGCIGCHEDGERTPENIMAMALTHPGANLMLAAERRRTVDFERDVAPILAAKCATAACHGGAARPRLTGKGVRFSAAYEALMDRYVTPGAARTSPLVWAIFGRNTSRPWDGTASEPAGKAMPPAGAAPLSDAERRTIIEWIDLGAHYAGLPAKGGER